MSGLGELARTVKKIDRGVQRAHRKAAAGAGNKVGARARKIVIDRLSSRLDMKKKYLSGTVNRKTGKGKGMVWLRRANPFDQRREPRAKVSIYASRVSLSKMSPKQTGGGVKAGPFNRPGAFVHQAGKWHGRGVVVGKRTGKTRHPVQWQSADVYPITESIASRVQRAVAGPYQREYANQLERYMAREAGRF